jgi:hypothetical protein
VWWYRPVIPTFKGADAGGSEFKVSLSYLGDLVSRKKNAVVYFTVGAWHI